MTNNVTQLPEKPRRCEYPQCHEKSDGYAQKFAKHFCDPHRKQLLLAESYLLQIEDEKKKTSGAKGLAQRLDALNEKNERVYVVDKPLMDEIRGRLVDQEILIKHLQEVISSHDAQQELRKDP